VKGILRIAALAAMALPVMAQDISGDWQGTLKAGGAELHLRLHFAKAASGGYTGTMDSVDQGANGIPIASVSLTGSKLKLEVKAVGSVYEASLSADGKSMSGTWTQGQPLPLSFERMSAQALRRPQDPVKPYPYREEEVEYENKTAGIRLAATLTIPPGKGPFPAVLLLTGSGPQDRNETVFGHHPFLVLADYLTRKGVVVLRADDRGVGKSGGSMATSTTADFATDAEAGLTYLKTRAEVNPRKMGLLGHSEGGVIAPMVAARNSDVAFVVMLAGTAVPGDRIIVEQVREIAKLSGASGEAADKAAETQRDLLDLVKQEKDPAALQAKIKEKFGSAIPDDQLKPLTSPWYRYFISYDPAPALAKVKCPVLALNGEKDMQVPAKANLPVIRKTLAASGNKDFEAVEMPGLNHLFQTAKTGGVGEYEQIEETMSPAVLEKIAAWILKH
jgi:pimeloyl-ACP methyl ester carboxylesterase